MPALEVVDSTVSSPSHPQPTTVLHPDHEEGVAPASKPALHKWLLPIGLMLVGAVIAGVIGYMVGVRQNVTTQLSQLEATNQPIIEAVVCSDDVQQCPDGTMVNRVGPACNFADCPQGPKEGETTIYEDGSILFNYPQGWKLVLAPPARYRYRAYDFSQSQQQITSSMGKMFNAECRGPVLENTEGTALIAFEMIPVPREDVGYGGFCWSNGEFLESVADHSVPNLDIKLKTYKWKNVDYVYPSGSDNLVTVPWQGDYFTGLDSNLFSTDGKTRIVTGLYSQEASRAQAVQALEMILTSLKVK